MFKILLMVFMSAFLSIITLQELHAETTVQLGADEVSINLWGADDHLTCKLNGKTVATAKFGDTEKSVNITPKLIHGSNKLTCVATDDNGGSCYAYRYEVMANQGGHSASLVHHSFASCCDSSCARPNPVLNETVWINNP